MYYYDKYGYLFVDGKVPGKSKPIVLDYKRYHNTCTSNVHFFFAFQSPGYDKVEEAIEAAKNASLDDENIAEMISTCPFGITFCYESQLDGENILDEYKVTNFVAQHEEELDQPAFKIALTCMMVHDIPTAHGFNMAVVAFPDLKREEIKDINKTSPDPKKYPVHNRFYVLTLSFTMDEYYFVVPKDGRVLLQIGDRSSLRTYFTDSEGNELPPVTFKIGNHQYGTTSYCSDNIADPYNRGYFEDHRGLWMLYLDFKRRYNELQVMNTVHSEDCNMIVQIRGNRMRKCRAYLQDIVVTEPSDAELEMVYTSEVGTIRKSDQGQEDIQEAVKKQEREELKKQTTKETETKKNESEEMHKKEQGEKTTHEKKKSESTKMHASASAKVSAQYKKPPRTQPMRKPGAPGRNRGGSSGGGGGPGGGGGEEGGGGGFMNGLTQGAKNFGGEFLNQAQGTGLLNDAVKLLDESPVGKAFKGVVEKTQHGIDKLKKVKERAEKYVTDKVDKVKKYGQSVVKKGEDMINNAKDKVKGCIAEAKKIGDNMKGKGEEEIKELKQKRDQVLSKIGEYQGQAEGYKGAITQKAGQISDRIGSLIGQTYDRGMGMMNKMGGKLGGFANLGENAINKVTQGMQNILPSGMGGAILDKAKSMIPGVGGVGRSFNASKIFSGLPEEFKNIPSGQGVKITERLTNVMKDFPMPSGMKDGFRNAKDLWQKGMDTVGSASNAFNKAQTVAVDMFESKFRETKDSLSKRGLNPTAFVNTLKDGPEKINKMISESGYADKIKEMTRRRPKRQVDTSVNAEGKIGTTKEDYEEETSKSEYENANSDSTNRRAFSDVTKSKSLMESFKSTTGITDAMTKSEITQSSQAFTKREIIDIKVAGLQKGKKLIISQLMFECDGNVVQLPKIYLHDGEKPIMGLSETTMSASANSDQNQPSKKTKRDTNSVMEFESMHSDSDGTDEYSHEHEESMISKMLNDGHGLDNYENMTMAERVAFDPSFLFYDDDEEEEQAKVVEEEE